MISGIGLDLIELNRVRSVVRRQPKLAGRILTQNELHQYLAFSEERKIEFLAGRFAAKEAYAKALGTGIGSHLSFQDIEIVKDSNGKPFIKADTPGVVHLSITHTREYAAAQVIIEHSGT
ncbi:holo-ACP synthase [Jeotgalibacillus campisalis]|uniref:Holo-[acyl-carrier-protein] synthase n=1 Tax=Jeotgalibacillus campisalis TaxID=220754 RepID=A0A0C2VX88_9BACL|nr:holo-ACP synthase [Jeotgalibacillus campisalis]KIL48578.1 4'-phosphopantetheinyl transferase [Jeotgalibacillus campisalis]